MSYNPEKLQAKILKLLRQEGFKITGELKNRVDHFTQSIEPKPSPKKIKELLQWFEDQKKKSTMAVKEIPIGQLKRWQIDPKTGHIYHETGEFFRVIGIRVTGGTQREKVQWDQPTIYQKEMGILGIIRKKINGVWYYLLQAKAEPGNIGKLQISPTLQATLSNLKRAHGGKKPLFAEYFENPKSGSVVYATYQTEDGGRLHLKCNLNMIINVKEDELTEIPDNFRWFTMAEIKQLLKHGNTVNLHVRSIISPL